MSDCYNPSCGNDATETYNGHADNEIELCRDCYYKAVVPVRSVSVSPTENEQSKGLLRYLFS